MNCDLLELKGSHLRERQHGQEIIPEKVHFKYIDDIFNVADKDSFLMALRLWGEEGIFCGGSTATTSSLCKSRDLGKDDVVIFIECDTGERYLSKFLSDEWMKEKRMLGADKMTVGSGIVSATSHLNLFLSWKNE